MDARCQQKFVRRQMGKTFFFHVDPVQRRPSLDRVGDCSMTGFLQVLGKTSSSCLLEDLALGSLFPLLQDVVVSERT